MRLNWQCLGKRVQLHEIYIWLTKRMVVLLTVGHCAMKFKRSLAVNEAMQQPILAAITYSSLQQQNWLGTRVGG